MTTGQNLSVLPLQAKEGATGEKGVSIAVSLVGDIQGQVLLRFTEDSAKKIASALMMGMPIEELDDMSLSALSELGNMVSGGTATHLSESGIATDITTPQVLVGENRFSRSGRQAVTIPLEGNGLFIDIDVFMEQ